MGAFARRSLSQVYASKCFIGVDGISLQAGVTTPISAEAEVARLMVERTRGQVIIVADHSKWGVISNFEIAPLKSVQVLVTDRGLPRRARADLRARLRPLLLAHVDEGPQRTRADANEPGVAMPFFGAPKNPKTVLFFATDVHGSERTWRKFLNAGKFYGANVLVMGGDIIGKLAVPIIREKNGGYRATLQGRLEHFENDEALKACRNVSAPSASTAA